MIRAMRSVLSAALPVAVLFHVGLLAQDRARQAETVSDFATPLQEVPIAPDDIETLISNLSGGLPTVVQGRVFSGGQIFGDYSALAPAFEPVSAVFNSQAKFLVVQGTVNGAPVVEDIRLIDFEGAFFVLRDFYLNGNVADLAVGRSIPQNLSGGLGAEADSKASQNMSLRAMNAVQPPPLPTISAIHGMTDVANTGINDGVTDMTCGNKYNGGRVVNGAAGVSLPTPFYWDVYGTNFGTSKGTLKLGSQTILANAITTWTPTYIRFYPTVPYNSSGISTTFALSNSLGGGLTTGVSITPSVSGRILGQCTYFVALTRLNAGKAPSPAPYPEGGGWTSLTAGYVPQLWDELVWEWTDSTGSHKHTAIITGVSKINSTTWTVTISEANAACNNLVTSRSSTYQVQTTNGKTSVAKPIQTSAVAGLGPGWFYR